MSFSCNYCRYVTTSDPITSTSTGKRWPLIGHNSCESFQVIYVITCPLCKSQYVGQTGRNIRRRISEHLRPLQRNEHWMMDKPKPRSRPMLPPRKSLGHLQHDSYRDTKKRNHSPRSNSPLHPPRHAVGSNHYCPGTSPPPLPRQGCSCS